MKQTKVITRTNNEEKVEIITEKAKRFFSRRKTFVNPTNPTMKFNRCKTYDENKKDYYKVLELVYTGKCKDIFEAYETVVS